MWLRVGHHNKWSRDWSATHQTSNSRYTRYILAKEGPHCTLGEDWGNITELKGDHNFIKLMFSGLGWLPIYF